MILNFSEGCVFIYLNLSVLNVHLDGWKERTHKLHVLVLVMSSTIFWCIFLYIKYYFVAS